MSEIIQRSRPGQKDLLGSFESSSNNFRSFGGFHFPEVLSAQSPLNIPEIYPTRRTKSQLNVTLVIFR